MPKDNAGSSDDKSSGRESMNAEAGPGGRKRAFLRERFALLQTHDAPEAATPDVRASIESGSAASAGPPVESPLPEDFHKKLIDSYRERQRAEIKELITDPSTSNTVRASFFEAPLPPPANNWVPLGPSVVRRGASRSNPAVSGRVVGIAVARGGQRVYVASANGGVWRSDDGGNGWRSMMEAWDLDPQTLSSDSLACGAIAIDLDDPDRVYVGTGEGGGEAFYGVGPLRTDDGGINWHRENTPPEESLDGCGFYSLAVDPADRERVVGATERGLYMRKPDDYGSYHWVRKVEGIFTSVVVARADDITTFYAARQGGHVMMLDGDGEWVSVGTGFPAEDTHRIELAVQPDNSEVVYALICRKKPSYHMRGVWRFDWNAASWREVEGWPQYLFGPDLSKEGQGWYDMAIAVAPNNINRVYIGGSAVLVDTAWCAALYCCFISERGSGSSLRYMMDTRYIGADVHSDVQTLEFTPGEPHKLWVGSDGGVFYAEDATDRAEFKPRNLGLATLMMNCLAMHPYEEEVIFCGTQDNGTVRFTGEEAWLQTGGGDGGSVVINWCDPLKILRTYTNGVIYSTTDGGQNPGSWRDASLPSPHWERGLEYSPLVGAPYNSAAPNEADIVAFGGVRLWLSENFGAGWHSLTTNDVNVPDEDSKDALTQPDAAALCKGENYFRSVTFASVNCIYAGTTIGEVHKYERKDGRWVCSQIGSQPLPRCGAVTSIARDLSDDSGNSIYVTLGGHGDYRHVWHFDGSCWEPRSGPDKKGGNRLLDSNHNSIVVDPDNPSHLYVGADIGVWRSTDGGDTWSPFSFGLPDAAVLDLKLHSRSRLLRAATHGRGVFEYRIDRNTAPPVELYLRDAQVYPHPPATEGCLEGPASPDLSVSIGGCPDIKVDVPSPGGGYQIDGDRVDFLAFTDIIEDKSDRVATSNNAVINRVYVQVHNRGLVVAERVSLFLLLAPASDHIPDLPPDFPSSVRNCQPVNTPLWRTIEIQSLDAVRVTSPQVATFKLSSTLLPLPDNLAGNDEFVLLAVLDCADDPYTNEELDVASLAKSERKATINKIRVVAVEDASPALPSNTPLG